MKLKEQLAKEIIDDYDNCVSGEPCIKDKIMKAYLEGFDRAKKDILADIDDNDGVASRLFIDELGEEEV